MDLDQLGKTALDRMQRVKYHLLKDRHQPELREAVLRYARKLARDRGQLVWPGEIHVDSPMFRSRLDGWLMCHLEALKAKRALCPGCEGPKQPKYRDHPNAGDSLQRILACPDCDPTGGARPTPRPEPEERPDQPIMGFKDK